jgi:glyoxylase-like metal-dependent hydrolase (beta-lactamase superfamily II)
MTYRYPLAYLAAALLAGPPVHAQDAPPELQTGEITPNIHVIAGVGGNVGVFSGADGVFVIDDGMPNVVGPLAAAIAAIEAVGDRPVRMLFNTHWHFDHVGGNEYFAQQGTLIVAHDNVRKRMNSSQFSKFMNAEIPPSPYAALPVVTFDTTVAFHLNGDTVTAVHIPNAHTDGDAVLYFEQANVVHMGDLFFNGRYPVVDISAGGSVQGMIDAIDGILPTLDANTKIIPGHGPLADIEDLRAFRSMLNTVLRRVGALIEEGKSLEEILAMRPSINFDAQWAWQFISGERFVTLVHESLTADAGRDASPGDDQEEGRAAAGG